MRVLCGVFGLTILVGCDVPASQSNHQNLNVKECRELALETQKSGVPNYNLCPGYMPDGYEVELFL